MPNGNRNLRIWSELRALGAAEDNELGVAVRVRAKRGRMQMRNHTWWCWLDYQRNWKKYRRTQYRTRAIAPYDPYGLFEPYEPYTLPEPDDHKAGEGE